LPASGNWQTPLLKECLPPPPYEAPTGRESLRLLLPGIRLHSLCQRVASGQQARSRASPPYQPIAITGLPEARTDDSQQTIDWRTK
jgi:hypothetical protein